MYTKFLAGLLVLITVNVQDRYSVSGDPLKYWAEPWLKAQEQLNLQLRVNIGHKAELLPTLKLSYSNEQFHLGPSDPPVLVGDISIMNFHGRYSSTVNYTWMEKPSQFHAEADFSGEIEINLFSFLTVREYKPSREYNLEAPKNEDAGLVEALESHKAAVFAKLQQKGKYVPGSLVGDILLKRIAKVVNKWYIYVHVHYFYNEESYYALYKISISQKKEITVNVVIC